MAIKPPLATAWPNGYDNFGSGVYDPALGLAVDAIESYMGITGSLNVAAAQTVMPTATASGTGTINTIQPINPDSQLRFITDGAVTLGSPLVTSIQAGFTTADNNKNFSNWAQPTSVNGGIPGGTTMQFVNSTTARMSNNSTVTLPNTTIQIGDVLTWSLPSGVAVDAQMTLKNVSKTLGVVLAPKGGDTINSSTTVYILPPQTTVTVVRDSATNWAPISTRIPGGLITFPRNSFGYVGTSYGLQWGGGAWANYGWLTNGLIKLGHRLVMQSGAYNAITGTGVTNAGYLARLALVLVANPGSVILEIGPNDVTGGQTSAAIQAAINAAIGMCNTSGRNAIVTTIPPNTSYTTGMQLVQGTVNAWIREQQAQDGVTVIDIAAALTDPLNTTPAQFISGLTSDGTHLTPAGSSACAPVVYSALVNQFSPTNLPSMSDATQVFTFLSATWTNESGGNSGFNEAPANPFGAAYYWQTAPAGSLTSAYTKPARTDGIPGTWQQIVIAPGDGGLLRQSNYTGGIAGTVGQAYRAYLEFNVSNVEATPSANKQQLNLIVIGYDNGSNAVMNSGDNFNFGLSSNQVPQPFGIFMTEPFVIPPTCTSLYWAINIQGGATYQFGRVGIIPVI